MIKPKTAPEFVPGNIIASDLFMGVVESAFWDETWCYGIGENASLETTDKDKGYLISKKFIRRGDIKWLSVDGKWEDVSS